MYVASAAPEIVRDVADEKARQVDDVAAHVAERSGTGQTPLIAPCEGDLRTGRVVGQVARGEMLDLAERPVLNQLLNCRDRRRATQIESDAMHHSGALRGAQHAQRFLRRQRERLFAQHVLAALQQRLDRGRVLKVRQRHHDQVDVLRVGHRLPIRSRPIEPPPDLRIRRQAGVRIGDDRQSDLGRRR